MHLSDRCHKPGEAPPPETWFSSHAEMPRRRRTCCSRGTGAAYENTGRQHIRTYLAVVICPGCRGNNAVKPLPVCCSHAERACCCRPEGNSARVHDDGGWPARDVHCEGMKIAVFGTGREIEDAIVQRWRCWCHEGRLQSLRYGSSADGDESEGYP